MAWVFNPFTGRLDFAGGGGGPYIDGEVQFYDDLPITVGDPVLDSAYLVREASGTWLLGRHPAGIYVRLANSGALSDWAYAGTFPDVFSDANFTVYGDSNSTKNLKFDVDTNVPPSTTVTLSIPSSSGTIAKVGDTIDGNNVLLTNNQDFGPVYASSFVEESGSINGMYWPTDLEINSKPVYKLNKTYGMFFEDSAWHIFKDAPLTINIVTSSDPEDSDYPNQSAWNGGVFSATAFDFGGFAAQQFLFVGDNVKVGTTSGLPIKTGSGGDLQTGAFGTSAGQFCEGNDSRLNPERPDNTFRIVGSVDSSKKVAFEVDGISTTTTRTLTVPNKDGTIELSQEIRSDFVTNTSYIGLAPLGSAESSPVWTIYRMVVDAGGNVTTTTATNVKWDDRLTATYS